MTTTIELGGLTFSGAASSAPGFYFRNLQDWYSVPESKSEVRERSQADGPARIDRDWRMGATPSFEAFYLGVSEEDALLAQRQFKRAIAKNRPMLMTVTDALGPTSRMVSVRSAPVPDLKGRPYFESPIDMTGDTYRLGPEVVAATGLPMAGGGLLWPITWPVDWGEPGEPGRVTTENDGDEETWSLLEVTGGLTGGFELAEIETGQILRFERLIPDGSTVFLNPRTARVYIDEPGNDVTGFLTRREWWSVPAGGFRTIQFNKLGVVSGTPTLTARTSPAY